MKLFIKLRNKYFTILALFALCVLSSLGLFSLTVPQAVEASMIKFDKESAVTITNGSFSSFDSQSTYPYSLSSFTTSGNKTPNMKTGAINVETKAYKTNYSQNYGLKEYDNPGDVGSQDDYVLMINNSNTGHSSNYRYTSSEFTLSKNGYFYVTVSAKTLNDGFASVYLTSNNVLYENCVIENITSTTWANYTFFIANNTYEDVKLKFNMQLGNLNGGSGGCVFFDELHAGQISLDTMMGYINNPVNAGTYKFVDNRIDNAYKAYNFDNSIIEYPRDSKGELQYDSNDNIITSVTTQNYFSEVTSGFGNKNVQIANNSITLTAEDSYITYKGVEEELDANSTYRFSIWLKTTEITKGSAFVQLDEILDEDEEFNDFMESTLTDKTAKNSTLTISSKSGNALTGGYVEYVIYVRTGAINSSKVQFSFGLGNDSSNATGEVSFKNYLIERIPYSAYSSVASSDTLGVIDISDRISSNSEEFSNNHFNMMQSESFDGIAYPATPSEWTKTTIGNGTVLSGVVNLSQFEQVMDKYSYINTMSTPTILNSINNNVLMIYNGTNLTHSYSSVAKSLTANKYYKITVFVNTYISGNSNNGASVIIKSGSTVLAIADNINTAGYWQKVELYIHTPTVSPSITLELALGHDNKTACGYAFFDNIFIESSDTENDFSNRFAEYVVANNGSVNIDLNNSMLTSTSGKNFDTPIMYTGSGDNTVQAGIVDLTGELKMISADKHIALKDITWSNKKALAIFSPVNTDARYTYTSLFSYSFEGGKYYKLSFDLFTDGIGQQDKENKYDNNVLAQGVNVELSNLENAKFKYVTSDGKWTHYEIYVGVDSTVASSLTFALGSEFTGCYGRAFLGNIELTSIEQSDFDTAELKDTLLKVDTIKSDEEDTSNETVKSSNGFSWVYIPTIATFVAIVVAVVGVFMRRNIKFKKRVKVGRAEYDRDITVMQNKYRRVAQDQRAKEIRELTKERDELVELRVEYEDKYKDALNRLRSARLANRDGSKRHEIMAIEHEVKHISKEVARFGVQINNYENEIEFMQTEAYLIDLEKRLMREDSFARNQVRKESNMTEEDRAKVVAKREEKAKRAEAKAKSKAEKLAQKQAKLKQQREQVQKDLEQAKALDEKYLKEQELKQIQQAEIKLAKEKAKAQREIEKLERKRAQESKFADLVTDDNTTSTTELEQTEEKVDSTETQADVESVEPVQQVDVVAEDSNVISDVDAPTTVEPVVETANTETATEIAEEANNTTEENSEQ